MTDNTEREALIAILDDQSNWWYTGASTVFSPSRGADAILASDVWRSRQAEAVPACSCPCHTVPGFFHINACCATTIASATTNVAARPVITDEAETIEKIAAAMWWQEFGYDRGVTREKRVQQELDHRSDTSWSGPVARYRRLARAALEAVFGEKAGT